MTLTEKVKKASEDAETPQEAAANLKDMLDKQEHSRVWSKYQTALKGKSKKEQKEFQNKSKAERGMEAALSLVKSAVPKFFTFKSQLTTPEPLIKGRNGKVKRKCLSTLGRMISGDILTVEELSPEKIPGQQVSGNIATRETSPRQPL